mmetsp:Transcript_49004/g.100019  ORF Transcript_49004/g.100019 Transcript_49004/m.100019 type:complete len:206 (-) Transcript_49004:1370-1987(-)
MGSTSCSGWNHCERSEALSISPIITLNSSRSMRPLPSRSATSMMERSSSSVGSMLSSASTSFSSLRSMPGAPALLSAPAPFSDTFCRTCFLSCCMKTSRALNNTERCISWSTHLRCPSRNFSGCSALLPRSHGGWTPATPGSMHEALTHSHKDARSWKLPSSEPRTTGPSEKRPAATTFIGWCLLFSWNFFQSTGSSSCMIVFIG